MTQLSSKLYVPSLATPSDAAAAPDSAGRPVTFARAWDWAGRGGFAVFLFLNVVLFVRPHELLPDMGYWPLYMGSIAVCAVLSLPVLIRQFGWRALAARPANLCVAGLLPALVLSNVSHGDLWYARTNGVAFLKVLVYYFLLVGIVRTRRRMEIFLRVLCFTFAGIALLSALAYHHVVQIDALAPIEQYSGVDDAGEVYTVTRLLGPGILNDPNDISLALVAGLVMTTGLFAGRKGWRRALLCAGPAACLVYALYLARSRGGFVSLVAASATLLVCRYGWRRTSLAMIVLLPALVLAFGGRQTDLNLDDDTDTGQQRMHLWRDSMVLFHDAPLFGIGSGQVVEVNGLLTHNSYVQAFAELGLIGGTLFVGAIYVPAWALVRRVRATPTCTAATPGRDGLAERVLAILAGYAVGIFSLTHNYSVLTFVMLGIATAGAGIVTADFPEAAVVWGRLLVRRVVLVSIALLVGLEVFVRFVVT